MTNSNQKERFQTKIAMLEQNNQVLQNKCEEYLGELIRTRKALEIAVDVLKWIDETYNLGMGYEATIMEKCELALEQITALEQKE